MSKISELLAKKKNVAAKAKAAEVETEAEESDEDEEEATPAPAKKVVAKKVVAKKAAPVVEEEDEEEAEESEEEMSDEEEAEESDEEDEEEAAPAPAKKVVAKKVPAKKAAPVVEEDDEDETEDSDEDEEEAAPAPAKQKLKIGGKAAATEKSSKKSEASQGGKKLLFQKAASKKEVKEVEEGGWMPREVWMEKLFEHLKEAQGGKFAMPNITTLDTLVKTVEKFLTESVLPNYSISLLGTKMRRVEMPDRIYAPTTGLERVSTKYHTFVPAHTKTTLTLTFGKNSIRGNIVNDEFVEGKFDGNKFTKGTWGTDEEGNETFKPAAAPKKK